MTARVGVIGYKNHAKRIINWLENKTDVKLVYIFHPEKHTGNDKSTNDFNDLLKLDAIFIASPNSTHFDYLKKLEEAFSGYVFCEKPPVQNVIELESLHNFKKQFTDKLYFNFNYRFSQLANLLTKQEHLSKIKPLHFIQITATHGLAMKEQYKNSWRARGDQTSHHLLHTVAIHFIDLLTYTFQQLESFKYTPRSLVQKKNVYDSLTLDLIFKDVSVNIYCSYAAPYMNDITLIGLDGFSKISNGKIDIYHPRNTFDENNSFITPPLVHSECKAPNEDYLTSLNLSFEYFLKLLKSGENVPEKHFHQSLRTCKLLFEIGN